MTVNSASDRPTTPPSADDVSRLTAGETASGASLDKVRDILFGAQSRDYDRRLTRLEERLVKEAAEIKEDVRKRIDVLEQFIKHESESLLERISRERDERLTTAKDLSREIRDASQAQDRKSGQIEEQLAKAQRDTRQQLLEQQNRLSEDLRLKVEDLVAAIAREAADLRHEKANRAVLASLFTEMAMRLNHEFHLPTEDTPGA